MTQGGRPAPAPPSPPERGDRCPRSAFALVLLALAFATLIAGFTALGVWQLHRRTWKLDLIARVDARVHAAPVPAPGPERWGAPNCKQTDSASSSSSLPRRRPGPSYDRPDAGPRPSPGKDISRVPNCSKLTAENAAYRHVAVQGQYRGGATLVSANTELGPGFWVLSPLRTARGFTVLINRGFVSSATHGIAPPAGTVRVTGLLRMSEPKGAFLRPNDPAANRWHSRDVAAIAKANRLGQVAPYFIDADRGTEPNGPVGGLTIIHFRNAHLSYALTWFALALLSVVGAVILFRHEARARRGRGT